MLIDYKNKSQMIQAQPRTPASTDGETEAVRWLLLSQVEKESRETEATLLFMDP